MSIKLVLLGSSNNVARLQSAFLSRFFHSLLALIFLTHEDYEPIGDARADTRALTCATSR